MHDRLHRVIARLDSVMAELRDEGERKRLHDRDKGVRSSQIAALVTLLLEAGVPLDKPGEKLTNPRRRELDDGK